MSTELPDREIVHEDGEDPFLTDDDILEEHDIEVDERDEAEPSDEENEDGDAVLDESISQFSLHGKPVFVIATHPIDPLLVVSGGEDDMGYLWRADSGEKVADLSGHQDSVICAGFSADGKMVATGGMDGRVRIWSHVEKAATWTFQTSLEGPDEVTWLDWHPTGKILLAGGQDGIVWMWRLPSGQVMHVMSSHTSSVTCGKWTPDGKRFVSASDDSSFIIWDPKAGAPLYKLLGTDARFRLEGGINSLAVNPSSTVAVCGGAEGGLRAVNLVNGTVINALDGHDEGASIEGIQFTEVGGLSFFITVATDGKVNVWESNTYRLRWTRAHDDAISSLAVHQPTQRLATSSADRTLRIWDIRSGEQMATLNGNLDVAHGCAWTADGKYVLSAGEDGLARTFSVPTHGK